MRCHPRFMPSVGPFEILEEIGRGGMGVVYRARDPSIARDVAVKLIRAATIGGDSSARLAREAQAVARLRHPGIVTVHAVGRTEDGHPWFAMELVDGRSLGDLVRDGALEAATAVEIVRDVALALDHAHVAGVIHRDLKPDNVLIEAVSGRARLTDFGLAHDESAKEQLTRTGELLGTPAYMAPEQADGNGARGPVVDVYGLGAILYHALVGRAPFAGSGPMEILRKVLFDRPTPPRELDSTIPPDLERVALRCLEKDPAHRYPSARAVADALDRILADGRLESSPSASSRRAPRRARSSERRRPAPRPVPPASRAVPAAIAGAGAVVAIALLALALSGPAADSDDHPPPRPLIARGEEPALPIVSPPDPPAPTDASAEAPTPPPDPAPEPAPDPATDPAPVPLAPADTSATRAEARTLFEAARARGRAGDLAGARAEVERAIALDPELADAYVLRASLANAAGELDRSLADLDRALELDPTLTQAWFNRGTMRNFAKDYPGAIADLTEAIRLLPDRADSWRNRGVARHNAGDLAGAVEDYERFLALAPGHPATPGVRALIARIRGARSSDR